MGDPFDVVMVCTGNMCRSPMMEHLLRRSLAERGPSAGRPWRVRSAGTHVPQGAWTHEMTLEALARKGIHLAPQPARSLDDVDAGSADLILVATTEQRAEVVSRLPSQVRRTFTLLQFARWCALSNERDGVQDVDADLSGERLLARALSARGQLQPTPPGGMNLPDPMGEPLAQFERTAQQIDDALTDMLGPGRIPAARPTATGATPVPVERERSPKSTRQVVRRPGVTVASSGPRIRRRS